MFVADTGLFLFRSQSYQRTPTPPFLYHHLNTPATPIHKYHYFKGSTQLHRSLEDSRCKDAYTNVEAQRERFGGLCTSRISSRTQVCTVFYNMPSFVIGAIGEVLARASLARHTETEASAASLVAAAAAVGGGAATAWGCTGAKVP